VNAVNHECSRSTRARRIACLRACVNAVIALGLAFDAAEAQTSLASRLQAAGTRTVAFSAAARPGVCGDGATYFADGFGDQRARYFETFIVNGTHWENLPCTHGPLRVTLRMVDGRPSRLRTVAGPLPVLGDSVLDLGMVSTSDAGSLLRDLARNGEGRVAEEALLPLVLVDGEPHWETLAAAARDSTRLLRYRRRASELLARGAASTLGAAAFPDDPAADQRREAVRALARRTRSNDDAVPDLIAIARSNKHPDARAAAIVELGQTADPRALDLFANILGVTPR
jgi:hypothetical protein